MSPFQISSFFCPFLLIIHSAVLQESSPPFKLQRAGTNHIMLVDRGPG